MRKPPPQSRVGIECHECHASLLFEGIESCWPMHEGPIDVTQVTLSEIHATCAHVILEINIIQEGDECFESGDH